MHTDVTVRTDGRRPLVGEPRVEVHRLYLVGGVRP